ncbi:MAG: KEOPS complex N(6)-L-threonylcarbamoyladenine synthase Kae1 [Candidatus Aenigmatarchaeota archaeon]
MTKEGLICLGIESSAHTFGIGIVNERGEILADEKSIYTPSLGKGIVPNEAKLHHEKVSQMVLKKAFEKANLKIEDIDIVAYTAGAGLPPCLLVGANFARELSRKNNKPLIPVCHQLSHLEIGLLTTRAEDPIFVYLSGGNTQIIAFVDSVYRIFGETEDIPIGNCLDVVAREMNLPMPGGPEIEKLAKNGKYVELPYVVKGMDVSYSGIATAAINLFKRGVAKEDIAYSLQETCFAMLTEVTERALAHTEKNEVLLVGGVAANKRLQDMMKKMCVERMAKMFVVPAEYSGDNGVMTAWTGLLAYKAGWKPEFNDIIKPKWRIDDIKWFKWKGN